MSADVAVRAAEGALAVAWPGVRFGVEHLAETSCLSVHWIGSPAGPSVRAVCGVVRGGLGEVPLAERECARHVVGLGTPSLLAEAVNLIRAWRAGDLVYRVHRSGRRYAHADVDQYSAAEADVSVCSSADVRLAQSLCALVGLSEEGHFRLVGEGALWTAVLNPLGAALVDCGHALQAALSDT